MDILYPVHWPQFYTATCNEWLPLLDNEKYKNIIVDSLRFLVREKRIELNAFVIMSNHLHLIWQAQPGYDPSQIQLSFMKYTAQQIKFELQKDNPALLEKCKVNKADRQYQVWKRDSLGIELFTEAGKKCFPMKTMQRMMLQRGAAATVTIVVAAFFCERWDYLKDMPN